MTRSACKPAAESSGHRCVSKHLPEYISRDEADQLFAWLLSDASWVEERVQMFGRSITVPRLVSWYGDDGVAYRYSSLDHAAPGWPPALCALRALIRREVCSTVNFVLLNRYRNGNDHMGWHRDDEPELSGPVVSVSLGATRRFRIQGDDTRVRAVDLQHGSLLVHPRHWRHCLPRTVRPVGERINLSFRTVRRR